MFIQYEPGVFQKLITRDRLMAVLASLPDGILIGAQTRADTGNMPLVRVTNDGFESVGYIDLFDDTVHLT